MSRVVPGLPQLASVAVRACVPPGLRARQPGCAIGGVGP